MSHPFGKTQIRSPRRRRATSLKRVTKTTRLDAALRLLRRGFRVVLVEEIGKAGLPGWETIALTPQNAAQHVTERINIGARLGPAGLTDCDLDCFEAIAAAPLLLPQTMMISGRISKPRSHYFYTSTLGETEDRATIQYRDIDGSVICELRIGGGGRAAFTVNAQFDPPEW
jgi:hypothetical protein